MMLACSFRTIYSTFQGYRIFASRKVAEKIEIQIRYQTQLYNVDVSIGSEETFEKPNDRKYYILLILYYMLHEDSHRFCY